MRPIDWAIVIIAPILVFLIVALIIWAFWTPTPIPFTPTGFTGSTGMTGFTGMTGPNPRTLIEYAVKHNLKVFPDIDPLSVLDITNLDCSVIVLTTNQELVLHGSNDVTSHKTNGRLRRILGFNGQLYALDISGKLWVLDGDLWDEEWDFIQVDEVNKEGRVIWMGTTLDQRYLWVTFQKVPGQTMGGMLFDEQFNMIDSSSDNMYRIYGKTIDKFITLNINNHTLKLTDGYIYSSVAVAILDCHNDLHTIPMNESPPLTGFRIICGQIYMLITLSKGTQTNPMNPMINRRRNPVMNQNNPVVNQNQRNQMRMNQPMALIQPINNQIQY